MELPGVSGCLGIAAAGQMRRLDGPNTRRVAYGLMNMACAGISRWEYSHGIPREYSRGSFASKPMLGDSTNGECEV